MDPTGGALEKIHPSTYLIFFALIYALSSKDILKPHLTMRAFTRASLVVFATLIAFAVILSRGPGGGGGEQSALIVTFITPAMLVVLMLYISDNHLKNLAAYIHTFFIINSMIIIFESITNERILPYTAGSEVITFDDRPTALLGHPLVNSLLTGLYVFILFTKLIRIGLTPKIFVLCGISFCAMLLVGGRAGLFFIILVSIAYGVHAMISVKINGYSHRIFYHVTYLIITLFLSIPLLMMSSVTDTVLDRAQNSSKSDATRLAAIEFLMSMSEVEIAIGVPIEERISRQISLNSVHGIELSWIALAANFGAPSAALLIFSLFKLMITYRKEKDLSSLYALYYYILTTFTSVSISSKTLSTSIFIIITASLLGTETSATQPPRKSSPPR